jgi:hypothetical protein
MSEELIAAIQATIAPSRRVMAITPDDTGYLREATRALYIGEGGDVALIAADDEETTIFRNVASGSVLDVQTVAVKATGTTASAIVGLL